MPYKIVLYGTVDDLHAVRLALLDDHADSVIELRDGIINVDTFCRIEQGTADVAGKAQKPRISDHNDRCVRRSLRDPAIRVADLVVGAALIVKVIQLVVDLIVQRRTENRVLRRRHQHVDKAHIVSADGNRDIIHIIPVKPRRIVKDV